MKRDSRYWLRRFGVLGWGLLVLVWWVLLRAYTDLRLSPNPPVVGTIAVMAYQYWRVRWYEKYAPPTMAEYRAIVGDAYADAPAGSTGYDLGLVHLRAKDYDRAELCCRWRTMAEEWQRRRAEVDARTAERQALIDEAKALADQALTIARRGRL